jgi:drug/metabolite transporter (DMT)-like permease
MSLFALGLLLLSACLHMGWNLLIKQAQERDLIAWWSLVVGAFVFFPLPYAAWDALPNVWWYAVGSAILQFIYYVVLSFAYRFGDFSLIYPLARGAAPIFLFVWSLLFLQETVTKPGMVGLLILICGIVVIGFGAWKSSRHPDAQTALNLLAPFVIALCISGYSALDGAAVQQVSPVPYTVLGFGLSALFMTPLMLAQHGWHKVLSTGRSYWRRIGLVALGAYTAYGLVLTVYTLTPISYAGAVREVSIVLAALAGWLWLGEPFGLVRTAGALIMCVGIFILTMAG